MAKNRESSDSTNGMDCESGNYDAYLMAMKRVHNRQSGSHLQIPEIQTPRQRYRSGDKHDVIIPGVKGTLSTVQEATRVSTVASMVPDEIIYNHHDHDARSYDTALMFIDISGFTDLCEHYTKAGSGGPSRLTQVLNSYIGAMVQEILAYHGDVLKFSGDAFLSMWKKTARHSMPDVVHTAIDCGLAIQKNYGKYVTDIGDMVLKVKIAISAGTSYFSIIGGAESQCTFVIVGQPVWDVKMAEYVSSAGDVLISATAWGFVNEAWYCTQPHGDGRHTKILGVGVMWKRVNIMSNAVDFGQDKSPRSSRTQSIRRVNEDVINDMRYREFTLRPAVIAALHSTAWPGLRRFMLGPMLRAVDNDEPMDFLTEVRSVVVVFLNIITRTVTEHILLKVVDRAYKCVSSVTSNSGGLVNKVSMFDKDMMFLVVFGLRGLKHEDEAQKALQCAYQLKTSLTDDNIIELAIAVTSGTTYCGVVGHILRREYTVIGPAVNKAARLMMAYPSRVTCDKETFLRSKLDQEYFKLMEPKTLKGIAKPGPIYEFNKLGWNTYAHTSGSNKWRHPLLGRNNELRKYKATLENAMQQNQMSFTRYRDHIFALAFIGPKLLGKTRLLEECLNITPINTRIEKVILTEETKVPYGLFKLIVARTLATGRARTSRENCENRIRYSINMSNLTPVQIYAVNVLFGCRFPLPETFRYGGDLLDEYSVKCVVKEIFNANFRNLWILAVADAQHTDDESWRLLLLLLETKTTFVVMTIANEQKLTPLAAKCLSNNMIVKIKVPGIDKWYHGALACQLLDVQAIPADLEKVIESASGGMPGWIQNFVISLVQRGVLTVVTTTRAEAEAVGAILPSPTLLQRADTEVPEPDIKTKRHSYQSIYSVGSALSKNDTDSYSADKLDTIQMAVLTENYNFDDLTVDMSMDVIILKTYDSLTPFEKMLLKCASVLGDVFSRRMLLHLLQSDSTRNVAQAVAKLFEIRVLECEGGDFTKDTSMVLVHPAPALPAAKPPYCACLGTRHPPNCRDLPLYAFCGYMKFRHSLFRTTTYELLTDNQKHEMHARALIFLERYTKRCCTCGYGCFVKLFGLKCDDGLIDESKALKRTRQQICALSAEARIPGESDQVSPFIHDKASEFKVNLGEDLTSYDLPGTEGQMLRNTMTEHITSFNSYEIVRRYKRVRSFSSLQLDYCECLPILMGAYCQVIDHCRGAGEYDKLYEAYLEYADLNILTLNIPQAVRLLFEVETFVVTRKFYKMNIRESWVMDFQLARIYSMRASCMLASGDMSEARKQLLEAMALYRLPFPVSKYSVRFANARASIRQSLALFVTTARYTATDTGLFGYFFDDIARAYSTMYNLFIESKEDEKATLAAKLALDYALRSNSNFRILCQCYGNLISTCRQKQKKNEQYYSDKGALSLTTDRPQANLQIIQALQTTVRWQSAQNAGSIALNGNTDHKSTKKMFLWFSLCAKLKTKAMELCHRKRGVLDVTEVQAVSCLYTNIFLFYVEYGKKTESLEFGKSVMNMLTNLVDLSTRQVLVIWMLKLLLTDLRIQDMVTIMREFLYMTDYYDLSSETWYYYYAMAILLDTGYCVENYDTCERFYIQKGDAILRSKTPEAAFNFFVVMWLMTTRIGAWEKSILWEDKVKELAVMQFERHEFYMMMLVRLVEGMLITLVQEMNNRNIKKIIILEKSVKTMLRDLDKACDQAPFFRSKYYLFQAYDYFIKGMKQQAFRALNKAYETAKELGHVSMIVWCEHTKQHWNKTLEPRYENYWVDHVETENYLDYKNYYYEKSVIIPFTLPLPRDLGW